MVKKMNDKLEDMEKAAVADIYDNSNLYAAPPPGLYGRQTSAGSRMDPQGIYGSVSSR